MGDLIANLFDISFKLFGMSFDLGNLAQTVINLCTWSKITSTSIWSMAQTLNSAIVPLGLSLLTLFAMIDLIKKTMEVDRVSWERVAMSLIRFLIFKMFITNSYAFLSSIMTIGSEWIGTVVSSLGGAGSVISLADQIKELINQGNIIDQLVMACAVLLLYLPMMGTLVGVVVQILIRVGKIILHFAFAPVPLAIGTWEDGAGTGKKFIMSSVALALEGLLIVVCAYIYSKGLSSLADANAISKMIAIMVMNGFFMAIVAMLSNLAEKWTGGN